ncbi:MAG: hypothetical protein V1703_03345 [Candidatus Altiarchaeota archaeon]
MASEWHAVEALNKALEKTNELLLKRFKLSFWLKLALVVFLIGGGGLNFNFNTSFPGEKEFTADFSKYLPVIIIIFAVLLVMGLVFSFIRAVCQFMFIETLKNKEIELINEFRRNLESGFSLFLFNLVLGVITLILALIVIAPIVYLFIKGSGGTSTIALVVMVIVGILTILCVVIISSIVSMLTTDFAIILMHKDKVGIINSWKNLWTIMGKNLKQFIVYVIAKIALSIIAAMILGVVGIVILIITLLLLIALGIGAGVIVLGLALALGLKTSALAWLIIPALIIAMVYFMAVGYLTVAITLPVPVFFRYYSILFLQDVEPSIKLIEDKKPEELEGEKREKEEVAKKPRTRRKKSEKQLKVY